MRKLIKKALAPLVRELVQEQLKEIEEARNAKYATPEARGRAFCQMLERAFSNLQRDLNY